MRNLILTFLLLTTLISCECRQEISGTVKDFNTERPLQNVRITWIDKSAEYIFTDSLGVFQIKKISRSIFGCPTIAIIIEKDGYEKKSVRLDHCESEYILLKPTNTKRHE
jgi:hypothetical protein